VSGANGAQISRPAARRVDMAFFSKPPVPTALTAHTDAMKNLIDAAVDAGNFKTLLSAFNSASLIDMLRSPGRHAIPTPTDAAFKRLPPGSHYALFKDARALQPFLCNHMMAGTHAANDSLPAMA
jgi:uncharacterized surface protein with fasciclin (FAS1) repeats